MTRETFYRLWLRGLAVGFAAFGAGFLLMPEASVRALDAGGAMFGDFVPAPASELRFWLALAVAYMVLVALLAWIAQRDLVRYRHLLAILAAGKAASALTALWFYQVTTASFVYLSTFVVDGSISLGALWIWAAVPRLAEDARAGEVPKPKARSRRAAAILDALLETMVPSGGAFPEGASAFPLAEEVESFVSGGGSRSGFRLFLAALEYSPFVLPPIWLRRFSRLSLEDRVRLLQSWEDSRFWPRRQILHALKLAIMSHFYSRPEIRVRIGYPSALERVPVSDLPALRFTP